MTKILIIDDDINSRTDVAEILEIIQQDYEVHQASSALEGIRLAQENQPDIILCDIIMFPHDGYYVLEQIRRDPVLRMTPFIFMTAINERGTLREGMELGADDVLIKPFTAKELLRALESRLNRWKGLAQDTQTRTEEAKRQLVRFLAHELRQPLTAMNLVSDLLTRQLGRLSEADLADLIDKMVGGNRRLNRLVEELVIVTQLRGGLLTRETIARDSKATALWEIVTSAISLARRFASARSDMIVNELDSDQSPVVLCSPALLRHAIAEIIVNFILESPDAQTVTITQQAADERVWLCIAVEGQGIPPEQIDIARENFRRFGTSEPPVEGLGLGLPLAQQLIELHEGIFELHSVPGHGTEVIAGLPLAQG